MEARERSSQSVPFSSSEGEDRVICGEEKACNRGKDLGSERVRGCQVQINKRQRKVIQG